MFVYPPYSDHPCPLGSLGSGSVASQEELLRVPSAHVSLSANCNFRTITLLTGASGEVLLYPLLHILYCVNIIVYHPNECLRPLYSWNGKDVNDKK